MLLNLFFNFFNVFLSLKILYCDLSFCLIFVNVGEEGIMKRFL